MQEQHSATITPVQLDAARTARATSFFTDTAFRSVNLDHARPAESGKLYKTFRHASSAALYLNRKGVNRHLYQWVVYQREDGTYELWTCGESES